MSKMKRKRKAARKGFTDASGMTPGKQKNNPSPASFNGTNYSHEGEKSTNGTIAHQENEAKKASGHKPAGLSEGGRGKKEKD